MTHRADIAVVGAGMAGASLAAELTPHASVVLLEAEDQPGYHSTGRSAAFWSETYGGPFIQPLTSASGSFLSEPPADFAETGFLKSRGAIHVASSQSDVSLRRLEEEFRGSNVRLRSLDREELAAVIPGLRIGWDGGLLEATCADIDVAALHAAYLRAARLAGARLITNARLVDFRISRGRSILRTTAGEVEVDVIVNAAGAWADYVARVAEISPVGIQPYRRTIAQLRIDPPVHPNLPLVIDASGGFYFKPEAGGRLWLSPHDETACGPCDTAAEEYDVALAIERLGTIVDWRVERVEHSWAGLRSFAPDRLPVYGFAPGRGDFFWFAGQGGFGIQTAPAAAKLAASLLLGTAPDAMVSAIDPAPYLAGRFRN